MLIWKKKTLWPLDIYEVQLSQSYRATTRKQFAFYRYIPRNWCYSWWSTSEGWKAESTMEPPSGFKLGTLGLGVYLLTTRSSCPFEILNSIQPAYLNIHMFVAKEVEISIFFLLHYQQKAFYTISLTHVRWYLQQISLKW